MQIKLYRDEVNKKVDKMNAEITANKDLHLSLEHCKLELENARQTIAVLQQKNKSDKFYLHDSDRPLKTLGESSRSTLPKSFTMNVIQEGRVSTVTSTDIGHNLRMEDEGEQFNNKYLTDLKQGKCVVPNAAESRKSRISELAWRNSFVPPHLKSSYPAETQFATPTLFKEDDLKTGNIDFDDSMSSKLLPVERPRKKDIGTTSYKKPGPPTPSKNGGRLSLQGGEHGKDVLREQQQNETAKTPKRNTPGRIKTLFLGRGVTNLRDSLENQPPTPKTKRFNSIFRRQH